MSSSTLNEAVSYSALIPLLLPVSLLRAALGP